MQRRQFLAASGAFPLAAAAADAPANSLYHLVWYYMRTGTQQERTSQFLSAAFLPALKRAGAGPAGFFSPVIGPRSPFVLSLVTYPSLAAMEAIQAKLAADPELAKAADEYNNIADPPYVRQESSLLRAFDGWPAPEVPPTEGRRANRIFELRTYESVNEKASLRKVKMFNEGEAAIFKRLGMGPVFFGKSLVGANQPNLSYMLSFDDLASRDKLWGVFGADPEWRKLRATPGYSDAELVSNISNAILRPLPFSPIR